MVHRIDSIAIVDYITAESLTFGYWLDESGNFRNKLELKIVDDEIQIFNNRNEGNVISDLMDNSDIFSYVSLSVIRVIFS